MNTNHENYKIYCKIIEDLHFDYHTYGNKITESDYIKEMKFRNIYEWYLNERRLEERKKKLKKLNENIRRDRKSVV